MSLFAFVTCAVLLTVLLDWHLVKKKPLKDKAAFIGLLLAGWLLSMFDLPNTPGPTSLLDIVFKPFMGLLKH